MSDHDPTVSSAGPRCSRRSFLVAGGATVSLLVAPLPWQRKAWAAEGTLKDYPKKKIASLSALKKGVPVEFRYPDELPQHSQCFVVKLGEAAGWGVGPDKDIVAFSSLCTHMGGLLKGTYKPDASIMGPCPVHLTTFDLTRHGIVVAGHATESLPQVKLQAEGDAVFAAGMLGLMFGRAANLGA